MTNLKSSPALVLLHKPKDITSFDCIRSLKRTLNRKDIGHCGTLDKFAEGLLPVAFGEGLKLTRFFLENFPSLPTYWKTYSGVIILGQSTTTGDPEGDILHREKVDFTLEQLREAAGHFVGLDYLQTPPDYSAKKVNGERASDIVRDGRTVSLKPVLCHLKHFEILDARWEDGLGYLKFSATCSKGTYIRKLAEDFAAKLGTVAQLQSLCRDKVGDFTLDQAIALESLSSLSPFDATRVLEEKALTLQEATSFLPDFALLEPEQERLKVGDHRDLSLRLANSTREPGIYRAMRNDGFPAALLELNKEGRTQFLRAFLY